MSHTYRYRKTSFTCNPDLSGDVTIVTNDGIGIGIQGDDILAFVADYVRREKISKIEGMTAEQLLGVE